MKLRFLRPKNSSKKLNPLELPASEQKRLYKKAVDESVDVQKGVIKRYESNFGERIEKGR